MVVTLIEPLMATEGGRGRARARPLLAVRPAGGIIVMGAVCARHLA